MSATSDPAAPPAPERGPFRLAWYKFVRAEARLVIGLMGGVGASGVENVPTGGGALLVSNHASYWDVIALAVRLPRPLNFVARSTLFVPLIGPFIHSVGAFPIQRDGMGSQGFKETLRRLRAGGIVTLFPEGTRTTDGELQPMRPGIGTLAARSRVSVVPAGLAGTFEAWPRHCRLPRPHPMHVHYGKPIEPADLVGLNPEAATALVGAKIAEAVATARAALGGASSKADELA